MRRHSLLRGAVVAAALVVAGTAVAAAPWPGSRPERLERRSSLRGRPRERQDHDSRTARRHGRRVAHDRRLVGHSRCHHERRGRRALAGRQAARPGRAAELPVAAAPEPLRGALDRGPASGADDRPEGRVRLRRALTRRAHAVRAPAREPERLRPVPRARLRPEGEPARRARDRRQARAGREDGRLARVARDERRPAAGCTRCTNGCRATPFVHALDANHRAAFCIDLPWKGSTAGGLELEHGAVAGRGHADGSDGTGRRRDHRHAEPGACVSGASRRGRATRSRRGRESPSRPRRAPAPRSTSASRRR